MKVKFTMNRIVKLTLLSLSHDDRNYSLFSSNNYESMIAPSAEVEEFTSLKSDLMDRDFKLGNPRK